MNTFNFTESVAAEFRLGQGEITLCEQMSDREIVSRIRMAMTISEGATFVIRPAFDASTREQTENESDNGGGI